jgi:hypothetical protein
VQTRMAARWRMGSGRAGYHRWLIGAAMLVVDCPRGGGGRRKTQWRRGALI